MEYRDLKTDPMQEAVKELLEKSKKAPVTNKDDDGEGMDPVGHGDKDIDNDGDHDSTDKYLTKRRKAISKNVKDEEKGGDIPHRKNKKDKDEVKEETVKLVDMDDDSHQNALKLAKKAGVKVVSKKTNTGTELNVSGSNKKIGKFMMSLPEGNEPTKANGGIAHDCATHVAHEEFGLGECVSTEHTLAEDGTVSHYDVIFERVGLKRAMPIEELKITKSEAHMHASKQLFTPAKKKGVVKGKIGKAKPA